MDECIWDCVHLTDDSILGDHKWKGKLDLLNIVLLGVPNKLPKRGEQYELHRLLSVLFSNQLTPNEWIDILENEYHIAAEMEFREEMDENQIAKAVNVSVEIVKDWFESERNESA